MKFVQEERINAEFFPRNRFTVEPMNLLVRAIQPRAQLFDRALHFLDAAPILAAGGLEFFQIAGQRINLALNVIAHRLRIERQHLERRLRNHNRVIIRRSDAAQQFTALA